MEKITYYIPNISCNHCIMHITKALNSIEGVVQIESDLENRRVIVSFQSPATDLSLRAALEEIGYPAN